ncbi:MAG: hypothetical protein PHT40_00925 [Patescibacteria group bacterium]|nr:hypothetical protein [Patescibacteria group bacterium]
MNSALAEALQKVSDKLPPKMREVVEQQPETAQPQPGSDEFNMLYLIAQETSPNHETE